MWHQKLSIHCTTPTEGIFPCPPPQSSFIYLLKFLTLWEPPTLQKFSIPSVGGIWIFSGTTQYDDRIGWKFSWSIHLKYWWNKTSMLFSGYVSFLLTTVIQVVIYRGTITKMSKYGSGVWNQAFVLLFYNFPAGNPSLYLYLLFFFPMRLSQRSSQVLNKYDCWNE